MRNYVCRVNDLLMTYERICVLMIAILVYMMCGSCDSFGSAFQRKVSDTQVNSTQLRALIRLDVDSLCRDGVFHEMLQSTCICAAWDSIDGAFSSEKKMRRILAMRMTVDTATSTDSESFTEIYLSHRVAALAILTNAILYHSRKNDQILVDVRRFVPGLFSVCRGTEGSYVQFDLDSQIEIKNCHKINSITYHPNGYLHQYVNRLVLDLIHSYVNSDFTEKPRIYSRLAFVLGGLLLDT